MEPLGGIVASKTTTEAMGLLSRFLGPTVDFLGERLNAWTQRQFDNVTRIAEIADGKTPPDREAGTVPPRVAFKVLSEGSYIDDAVMADYLGGVLAASKTPSGRDDRAVTWSNLITNMSRDQLRAHYLLYREWVIRLHGKELNLGIDTVRHSCAMDVDLFEFIRAMSYEYTDKEVSSWISHVIPGLIRLGLLDDNYSYGRKGEPGINSAHDFSLRVVPSVSGIELYGWGQGATGMSPGRFTREAEEFLIEPSLPQLSSALFPSLSVPSPDDA